LAQILPRLLTVKNMLEHSRAAAANVGVDLNGLIEDALR